MMSSYTAVKHSMKLDDFPQVEIQHGGKYRLVSDQRLTELIAAYESSSPLLLLIQQTATSYGTTVQLMRTLLGMTRTQLADKAQIERKALYLIEEGQTKKPKGTTHAQLVMALGTHFEKITRDLGFYS